MSKFTCLWIFFTIILRVHCASSGYVELQNRKWCSVKSDDEAKACIGESKKMVLAKVYLNGDTHQPVVGDPESKYELQKFLVDVTKANKDGKTPVVFHVATAEAIEKTADQFKHAVESWMMVTADLLEGPGASPPAISPSEFFTSKVKWPAELLLLVGFTSGPSQSNTPYPKESLSSLEKLLQSQKGAHEELGLLLDVAYASNTDNLDQVLKGFKVVVFDAKDPAALINSGAIVSQIKVLRQANVEVYLTLNDNSFNAIQDDYDASFSMDELRKDESSPDAPAPTTPPSKNPTTPPSNNPTTPPSNNPTTPPSNNSTAAPANPTKATKKTVKKKPTRRITTRPLSTRSKSRKRKERKSSGSAKPVNCSMLFMLGSVFLTLWQMRSGVSLRW